ncbi:MAG: hypothetical protein IKI62_03120 [Clostridia bacterium]|nr:hypothetical protein [Clostridia bacterium]
MKTRMFFPILLIILMIFMLQFAFFPRKGNSEELPPANAMEIIEDTVSHIHSIVEGGSVTAVADKLKECTDPYEREYIIGQFLDEMSLAQDSGDISRLEYYEDSSIVSFYVDNLAVNICLEEQSDLYSGISSEGLPPSIPLTGGNEDSSSSYGVPVPSGKKLKALILSWDNQPYDRKDLENIDDLGNATHWDLAQLYEYHMTHNACADIQVDRIDDFGIKDIKKDIFDDYDLIYINTHGYLKDGFPYFETSEVGGWLNLKDNGIWKKGELHLPEGVELYFDIGDPFESGHYAIGPDYMINEFPENSLKARWVHLGMCHGMDGNIILASILHEAGVGFISGYDDEQYKNLTYMQFNEMLPVLLNAGTFSEAMDAGNMTASKHSFNNEGGADLVWYPTDSDALSKTLFCGFKVWIVADDISSGYFSAKLLLDRISPDPYDNISITDGYSPSSLYLYTGLEDQGQYRLRIEAPGYEAAELTLTADYNMEMHDILLHYIGDAVVPSSQVQEGPIAYISVRASDLQSVYLPDASVQIYGISESGEWILLTEAVTDSNGETNCFLPAGFTSYAAHISHSGYNAIDITSGPLSEDRLWQATVTLNPEQPAPPDHKAEESELLALLVERYGVMPGGQFSTQTDMSKPKNVSGRTTGLLFADSNDYDGDGMPEILTLRNAPSFNEYGSSTEHIYAEIYEYRDNSYELADSKQFTAYTLSCTNFNHALSVFRYSGEHLGLDGTLIGIELFSEMNSENTSLVVLRYGNEKLHFLGGANYGEWDGSDDMRSCMSIPATDRDGFILDIDGEGFNDWSIRDHSSEPLQNGVVQGYLNELLSMGLEGQFVRSIYDEGGPERTAVYSQMDASSCYTATESELTMLGTISTYNLYDTQYLTVTDHTVLLDAYR